MIDQQTLEQARYIFSVGKKIRHHVFTSLHQLEIFKRDRNCSELSVAQMNLLMAVRSRGELTLTGLAEILRVSPPSVSVMVDRLVEREMLIRERSTSDRRRVVIGLTVEADRVLAGLEEKLLAAFVGLVEEVGPETAAEWADVLQRVEEVLQRQKRGEAGKREEGTGGN